MTRALPPTQETAKISLEDIPAGRRRAQASPERPPVTSALVHRVFWASRRAVEFHNLPHNLCTVAVVNDAVNAGTTAGVNCQAMHDAGARG